jgi:hypothetical protein
MFLRCDRSQITPRSFPKTDKPNFYALTLTIRPLARYYHLRLLGNLSLISVDTSFLLARSYVSPVGPSTVSGCLLAIGAFAKRVRFARDCTTLAGAGKTGPTDVISAHT